MFWCFVVFIGLTACKNLVAADGKHAKARVQSLPNIFRHVGENNLGDNAAVSIVYTLFIQIS